MKVTDLSLEALTYWIALAEGYHHFPKEDGSLPTYVHQETGEWHHSGNYCPPTKCAQAGPIIFREKIGVVPRQEGWAAFLPNDDRVCFGPTPEMAAMRCYVMLKYGDDVPNTYPGARG